MARNETNRSKYIKVSDHSAASTAAVTSIIVDTAGYQGVVFLTSFGTANATNTAKVQGSATNATDDMADLTGTSITSGSSDEDLIVEIHKPQQRYVQLVVARGASSTLESIWAQLYGGDPASASLTGTRVAELNVSPAAGTA